MSTTFTWSTRRDGNSGFVLETHPDGSSVEFGPMPCSLVLPFVSGRRRIVNHLIMKLSSYNYASTFDWNHLLKH